MRLLSEKLLIDHRSGVLAFFWKHWRYNTELVFQFSFGNSDNNTEVAFQLQLSFENSDSNTKVAFQLSSENTGDKSLKWPFTFLLETQVL